MRSNPVKPILVLLWSALGGGAIGSLVGLGWFVVIVVSGGADDDNGGGFGLWAMLSLIACLFVVLGTVAGSVVGLVLGFVVALVDRSRK